MSTLERCLEGLGPGQFDVLAGPMGGLLGGPRNLVSSAEALKGGPAGVDCRWIGRRWQLRYPSVFPDKEKGPWTPDKDQTKEPHGVAQMRLNPKRQNRQKRRWRQAANGIDRLRPPSVVRIRKCSALWSAKLKCFGIVYQGLGSVEQAGKEANLSGILNPSVLADVRYHRI
ncbi:uncharacterized protein P884DRAFT_272266 [Thermothelomyces heterothallicus CBS 202.75]|uniref:uncharacterized protein n=1 Tax=Thermothelomyces heterothallicus CBS 202.75 TaxID=1149848 RepID=UPI003743BFD1